jgi:hypothetical protein
VVIFGAITVVVTVLALPFFDPGLFPPAGPCAGDVAQPLFDLENPNGSPVGAERTVVAGSEWFNFSFVHCGDEGLTIGNLSLLTIDPSCGVASGVVSYTVSDNSHAVLGVDNASTRSWELGGPARVPQQGFIDVLAHADLSPDSIYVSGGGLLQYESYSPVSASSACY